MNLGGISQLARLMKTSLSQSVLAEVAGAIWSLAHAEDGEIKVLIARAQTIPPLVGLLSSTYERSYSHAALALASLGLGNVANQVQITQLLIDLLTSSSAEMETLERAVAALQTLVAQNPISHYEIARAGKTEALVQLLRSGIPSATVHSDLFAASSLPYLDPSHNHTPSAVFHLVLLVTQSASPCRTMPFGRSPSPSQLMIRKQSLIVVAWSR